MGDFQLKLQLPIPLFCDNKAAIAIAAKPIDHERMKHIDNDCHLVREHIERGFISAPHIESQAQLADSFTKAVSHTTLTHFLPKFGTVTHSNLREKCKKSVK